MHRFRAVSTVMSQMHQSIRASIKRKVLATCNEYREGFHLFNLAPVVEMLDSAAIVRINHYFSLVKSN